LPSCCADLFFKNKTAKNRKTMALLLPDEVINTTGLFSDVHALITDLIRKGIPDIFAYREANSFFH